MPAPYWPIRFCLIVKSQILPGLFFLLCGQLTLAQPVINNISPLTGPIGTTITITGTNFSPIAAENIVFFGGIQGKVIGSTSTSITATVPAGASYKPITVTTNHLMGAYKLGFGITFRGGDTSFAASTFSNLFNIETNFQPTAIATGDFDGDGRTDFAATMDVLASGSRTNGILSIYLNNSTGTKTSFSPERTYPTSGHFPYSISVGDLNGDGKLDLIVINAESSSISIFSNTGNPSTGLFRNLAPMPTSSGPSDATIADLDGDGKPEIIVSIGGSNVMSIFHNTTVNGTISFDPRTDFPTPGKTSGILANDFEGDGKIDLVAADFSGALYLFRNSSSRGTISFDPQVTYTTGNKPETMESADFDGDGKPDLALSGTTRGGNTGVSIFQNTSNSNAITFNQNVNTVPISPNSFSLAIGDIDGNGQPDLVVANFDKSTVTVSRNISVGQYINFDRKIDYYVGSKPWGVALGDLDGDGKPDIVTPNYGANTLSALKNNSSPLNIYSFTPTQVLQGDSIYVIGSGFTGITSVMLGGIPAARYRVVSPRLMIVTIGTGQSGNVSITSNSDTASLEGFVCPVQPVIDSFGPLIAGPGGKLMIHGKHLLGTSDISLGNNAVESFTVPSDSLAIAIVGSGASGNLNLVTPGGSASATGFIFSTLPIITSFTPDSGSLASTITITGANFLDTKQVSFGGEPAQSFYILSYNTIKAIVGFGNTGSVSVMNSSGTAYANGFVYAEFPFFYLTQYDISIVNNEIVLDWISVNDTSIMRYIIEYSKDTIQFTAKDSISRSGPGVGRNSYRYTDHNPQTGNNYYRLAFKDTLGKITYSPFHGADVNTQTNQINAYPNPVTNHILVHHPSTTTNSQVQLVDMSSKLVKTVSVPPNQSQTDLNLGGVQPGIYMIVWRDGKNIYKQRILVQ